MTRGDVTIATKGKTRMTISEEGVVPGARAAAPVSSAAAWFTLWALVATMLFAFMDRQMLSLLAAPMAKTLGLKDAQLGLVNGLSFSIFTLVAAYPIAWLADRIDRRIVLGACVLIWVAGTAACGLAQNFEQLFAAAIAVAAGEAGLGPIALAVVPDLFSGKRRVTANLVYYLASILGVSLGLALGGGAVAALDAGHSSLPAAMQSLESWRLAFLLVSAPVPLFLVLIVFMRLRRPPTLDAAGAPAAVTPMAPYLREHGRTVALVLSAIGLLGFAFAGIIIWMPAVMQRVFAVGADKVGVYMGISTAIGTVAGVSIGFVLMRWLQPRLGVRAPVRITWVAMLIGLPFTLVMPFVTAAWQVFALVGLMMTAATIMGSMSPNILQDLAPTSLRARVMAIYTMIYVPFGGLSVLAGGALSDMIGGPRSLLWAMCILCAPTWLLAVILFRLAERPFERTATWVNGG
jgi:MFS family permease